MIKYRVQTLEGFVEFSNKQESDLFATSVNSISETITETDIQPLSNVKIYRYINDTIYHDLTRPPKEHDFVVGLSIKMHEKVTMVKGEVQKKEHYANFNGTTYSDLIVVEDIVYNRNALGFAVSRTTTRKWICEDQSVHPDTKISLKYYSANDQIEEGITRRGNLIKSIQQPVMGLIAFAWYQNPYAVNTAVILDGRKFLLEYQQEFNAFVNESNKAILECLGTSSNPRYADVSKWTWIDSMTPYGITIRQYIISQLTI
jgi:hypothetical protein